MMLLASHAVVLPTGDQPRPATLVIDDAGRLAAVHDGIEPGAELIDGVIVPGFVDTHCHGGAGAAFTDAEAPAAIAHHRRHGSTTLFASTVTAGLSELTEQLDHLRPLVASGELGGVHLEGPFLSAAKKGAHTEALLVDPTPERIVPLVSDPIVRMVTLAPERGDGMSAVAACREHGVVAAFGHSDADAATTQAAIDAGASVATHLFNAMRPINHREPGPVPVLLDDPRVMVELICDGVHLAPEIVRLAIAAAPGRVGLVTDAMSATGCPDGDYELGGLGVRVLDGVARLVTDDGSPGAIAGSTLTMDRAVQWLVELGTPITDVARMAATTPARWHGLTEVGRIAAGCWADLCVLDRGGRLQAVMRRGEWVVPPSPDPTSTATSSIPDPAGDPR